MCLFSSIILKEEASSDTGSVNNKCFGQPFVLSDYRWKTYMKAKL
jgi:hypothetical protein